MTRSLPRMQDQPLRNARDAIMQGLPVPAKDAAALEARGVDVGALEIRLRNIQVRGHAL